MTARAARRLDLAFLTVFAGLAVFSQGRACHQAKENSPAMEASPDQDVSAEDVRAVLNETKGRREQMRSSDPIEQKIGLVEGEIENLNRIEEAIDVADRDFPVSESLLKALAPWVRARKARIA